VPGSKPNPWHTPPAPFCYRNTLKGKPMHTATPHAASMHSNVTLITRAQSKAWINTGANASVAHVCKGAPRTRTLNALPTPHKCHTMQHTLLGDG